LIAVSLARGDAVACLGRFAEWTIFFDAVPHDVDAPAIVEVTITNADETQRPDGAMAGTAHVDRVIKGPIDVENLRLLAAVSSCGGGFTTGERGIVMGELRRDAQGVLELQAIHQTWGQREARKNAANGVQP
jgi:hypothetical protein